ncbi:uncharacterized protein PpBr36_10796 [Pyricularia pennisetigena]|uniref:uncharacterized protein n=1 Tax=Pyricularia pennisetigena TaxID=1578925 RepID=UPI00114E4CE7|nr:uncharacterized protein PpBr36_10796 [Pyricularia pennisetigena]TLS20953.1 hypothetical protein PpBr36_10796 [Pyricularia pennisetigena]
MPSLSSILPLITSLIGFVGAQDVPRAVARAPATCPLTFDGRIPQDATAKTFTTTKSPFDPKNVLGKNVTWDQVIEFPNIPPSRFDKQANTKPVGLSLSDKSIFLSGTEGMETALRRTELVLYKRNDTVSGHVTWHLSVRTDPSRPLNYSHEYLLAFHEAQDYQADFWSLKVGTPMLSPLGTPPEKVVRLEGWKWDNPVKTFWQAPLTDDVWHNFGIGLDFNKNLISLFYSTNDDPLRLVVPPTANNISGKAPTTLGETHFGLQKRPVGANLENFLFNGTQPRGINEAFFFGGIFQDNSASGCITV